MRCAVARFLFFNILVHIHKDRAGSNFRCTLRGTKYICMCNACLTALTHFLLCADFLLLIRFWFLLFWPHPRYFSKVISVPLSIFPKLLRSKSQMKIKRSAIGGSWIAMHTVHEITLICRNYAIECLFHLVSVLTSTSSIYVLIDMGQEQTKNIYSPSRASCVKPN